MNITSYSRQKIRQGLKEAHERYNGDSDHIRVLFAPTVIDEHNFDRACAIYSRIDPESYDTVVIVEAYDEVLEKKLPMPSHKFFETPLGTVPVNDDMRNEFCDEEDDFYIYDEGFSTDMSLFQQLMMLQCVNEDFSVVSIQIADQRQTIVEELAHVLEEVLASRNTLLIFCCELDNQHGSEFDKIKELTEDKDQSRLMDYLNSGESRIKGTAAFIAGLLVTKAWNLKLNFANGVYEGHKGSLITAYAGLQKILL